MKPRDGLGPLRYLLCCIGINSVVWFVTAYLLLSPNLGGLQLGGTGAGGGELPALLRLAAFGGIATAMTTFLLTRGMGSRTPAQFVVLSIVSTALLLIPVMGFLTFRAAAEAGLNPSSQNLFIAVLTGFEQWLVFVALFSVPSATTGYAAHLLMRIGSSTSHRSS